MFEENSKNTLEDLFFEIMENENQVLEVKIITESTINQLINLLEINPEFHFYADEIDARERFFRPFFTYIMEDEFLKNKLITEVLQLYQKRNPIIENLVYLIILGFSKKDFLMFVKIKGINFIDILLRCFELYNLEWDLIVAQFIGKHISNIVRLKFEEATYNKDNEILFHLIYNKFLRLLTKNDTISLFNNSKLNLLKYLVYNYNFIDKNGFLSDSFGLCVLDKICNNIESLNLILIEITNKFPYNKQLINNVLKSRFLHCLTDDHLIWILPIIIKEISENEELIRIFLESDLLIFISDNNLRELSENQNIDFINLLLSYEMIGFNGVKKINDILAKLNRNYIQKQLINTFKNENSEKILKLLKNRVFDYLNNEQLKAIIKDSDINFFNTLINIFKTEDLIKIELWKIFWDVMGKDISLDNIIKQEVKRILLTKNQNVIRFFHRTGLIKLLFSSKKNLITNLNKEDLVFLKNTYEVIAEKSSIASEDLSEIYFFLNNLDKCIELATDYANNYLDNYKAQFYLGRAYSKKKYYDKAIKSFKEAFFAIDYSNIDLLSIDNKDVLYYISKTHLKKGDYEDALSACNNLINLTLYEPALLLRERILIEMDKHSTINELKDLTFISQIQRSSKSQISFKNKFKVVLRNYGLSKHWEEIFNLLKFKIRINFKHKVDNLIPIGVSKFGGAPDLPPEFEWPYWKKRPLCFLMQIDLKEIDEKISRFNILDINKPIFPINSGLLYIFIDYHQEAWGDKPEDKGSLRVIYSSFDKSKLIRMGNPSKHGSYTHNSYALTFYNDVTLPIGGLHVNSELIEDLKLSTDEENAYNDLINDFILLDRKWDAKWLFGYPIGINNDNNGILCEKNLFNTNKTEEIHKWELLLQLGEIYSLDWGNGGYLQIWIKNLLECNFSKTWAIIESINSTMRFKKSLK